MENVLKKIINKKKERIKIFKKKYSENKLFEDIKNINSFINFKDKIKYTRVTQTNYKKNDLENFNNIIKSEESYEKNSVKIVNVYGCKNSKSKKANLNLKKIKILYFD